VFPQFSHLHINTVMLMKFRSEKEKAPQAGPFLIQASVSWYERSHELLAASS
jgi:hypothetical protein